MTTLRVATLNLWGRNGPKLVELQEVMRDEPPGTCQAGEIAASLGDDVAVLPGGDPAHRRSGERAAE
jgi:hypothetical protein